jgi:4-cresol dehydrogenase (hydroxylating)
MSSIDGPTLTRALLAWRQAIGSSSVSTEAEILKAAGTATFATRRQVLAILRPADRAQVQECVRIANQFRVPIYPISTGKNWGYGSRAPVDDGVLLDLSRLNRILDFDETLAYVTVEPGVTQKQLYEFLQAHGSRLWMDATGASPDCSIIGNTLERGFGHTPMGEHCNYVCGLEVILSSGEILETGLARFPGAAAAPLSRWGVGPSLDGLFSQSNFGIVTRMSVWLMPVPEYFQAYYFQCENADGVAGIIDALRPLRLDGTIRSTVHVGNDYKVLASVRQYPWKEMNGKTPLDPTVKKDICRDLRIASWSGSGGLYGTRDQVRAARARVRSALGGKVSRLVFVDDRRLRLMRRFATPFSFLMGWDVNRTLGLMMSLHGLLKGVPTEAPLASTYWRKRSPAPEHPDPDRDGCGLIWCSPVLPNTGTHAAEIARLIDDAVLSHGFEPMMSFSLVSERSIVCVAMIGYDREVAGEDERAFECHQTLTRRLIDRGYPPYRLNVRSMNDLEDQTTYLAVLRSLKSALDPKGILAPGRYEPGSPADGVTDRPATLAG